MLLPHRAVLAVVGATKAFLDQVSPHVGGGQSINEADTILSYLPLAHIFDRRAPSGGGGSPTPTARSTDPERPAAPYTLTPYTPPLTLGEGSDVQSDPGEKQMRVRLS